MSVMRMAPGEHKLADVTAPMRALTLPVLELIIITGLAWMGIGWMDAHGIPSIADTPLGEYPTTRNGLVGLWAVGVAWRFILPVMRHRRKRFILTNQRIIARPGNLGGRPDNIWLGDVLGVRRRRGGISLAIRGYEQGVFMPDVAKNKQIEKLIHSQLRR